MNKALLLISACCFSACALGQDMIRDCARQIKLDAKGISFSKYRGKILITGDTIKYGSSVIILKPANAALVSAFTDGILYPALIGKGGASHTRFDQTIRTDTINIIHIEEVLLPGFGPTFRTYSFTVKRKNNQNAYLYLFELENRTFDPLSDKSFLQGARLTAFGFCTILI